MSRDIAWPVSNAVAARASLDDAGQGHDPPAQYSPCSGKARLMISTSTSPGSVSVRAAAIDESESPGRRV
jgi:hypothetical protein